jgi:2-amino-4-hydroxy-6-hydroxymethyldihydropteridine diphosphokinase
LWNIHESIVSSLESHSAATGHATLRGMLAQPSLSNLNSASNHAIGGLMSRDLVFAFVALGANLGDAQETVLSAIQSIAQLPQSTLISSSSLYRTAPVESSGADYINAVVKISTALPVYALLKLLQNLEHTAGRERPYRNAPRTLDLDLLLYGDAQIQSDSLTVPHPRMSQRAFVLIPLAEIAPERVSVAQLQAVSDQQIARLR